VLGVEKRKDVDEQKESLKAVERITRTFTECINSTLGLHETNFGFFSP